MIKQFLDMTLSRPITTNYMLMFVIGVLTVFPSMMPTANALKREQDCDLYKEAKLEDKMIWLWLPYGILSIIVFSLANYLLPKDYRTYGIIGAIFGLIYPTLGTIDDYAKRIYGIDSYYSLYAGAQFMYIFYYGIIVALIDYYIRL